MKLIPLTQGCSAKVDDADYGRLSKFKWCALFYGGYVYAARSTSRAEGHKTVGMSRDILGLGPDDLRVADHINGDTLDNRRSNLRAATRRQNRLNRHTNSRSNTGIYGVYKVGSRYRAVTSVNSRTIHLGYYDTAEQAHQAVLAGEKDT